MATLGTPNAAEAFLSATTKIMEAFDEPLAPIPRWAGQMLDLNTRRLARAYLANAKVNLDMIPTTETVPVGMRAKMTPEQIVRATALIAQLVGVRRGLTYRVQELTKVLENYNVNEE